VTAASDAVGADGLLQGRDPTGLRLITGRGLHSAENARVGPVVREVIAGVLKRHLQSRVTFDSALGVRMRLRGAFSACC
jgi:hypothetical protein